MICCQNQRNELHLFMCAQRCEHSRLFTRILYWEDKKQYWKKIKDFHKFILESQKRSKAQRIVYIALAIKLTSRNEMYTVFMIKSLLLGAVLLGTYWCNPNFSCPSVLWTEWQSDTLFWQVLSVPASYSIWGRNFKCSLYCCLIWVLEHIVRYFSVIF